MPGFYGREPDEPERGLPNQEVAMTPCAGPSLSSPPAGTPATTCGCGSQPAEQPAFAHAPSYDRELVRSRTTLDYGISFDPIHDGVAPAEAWMSFLLPVWLGVALLLTLSRRPRILRLGLVGPPVEPRPKVRLVLSERERRALRKAASWLGDLRFAPLPMPLAFSRAYSQPRLRNHMSMPPPMARHTPQKIG
jgi:hypothetical protein